MPEFPGIMTRSALIATFPVRHYDLARTLNSGQAFRWRLFQRGWESVIGGRWIRLVPSEEGIEAEVARPVENWDWLKHYLQVEVDLPSILATFPRDAAMGQALEACAGLRLLRQDPWECLASFILSSTKQIVQIQQIVHALCERFGAPVPVLPGHSPCRAFPPPEVIAACSEEELRGCKMGFRAPYLKAAAVRIARKEIDLDRISRFALDQARSELLELPGVGPKIANCVLLFAFGFPKAFPVDVWILKALRHLYFRRAQVPANRIQEFTAAYFGPWSGYAQQYLFHYMRTAKRGEPELVV
jgi:N-glycosylase/DNA lyase